MKKLQEIPEMAAELSFEEFKEVDIPKLNQPMMAYIVEKRQLDSLAENLSDGVDHPSYGSQSDDKSSVEDPKEKLLGEPVTEGLKVVDGKRKRGKGGKLEM